MKLRKLRWIGFLMGLSQLMLAVFVVQWLFTQFRVEKDQLSKDVGRQLTEAREQVMDSMLVHQVITPILHDSMKFNIQITSGKDSSNQQDLSKQHKVETYVKHFNTINTKVLRFRSGDTANKSQGQKASTGSWTYSSDNMVLEGVKLIIGNNKDSIKDERSIITQQFQFSPDTGQLLKILNEKLTKEGYKFSASWIQKSRDKSNPGLSVLIFETGFPDSSYGIEITNYKTYLFRKISAQTLFAFILLLFTGAAFLIAYRSLSSQMMLSTLRNEFVSNVSHELKTPVATVKVALEALRNFDMKKDPATANDYFEMASLEMSRLDLLINKVLNTSILEGGDQLIYPETTDLKILTQEVLQSLQLRFSKENTTVNFLSAEGDFILHLDRLYIQGVIINLLDNSLKYAGENAVINVKLGQKADSLQLSVSDNGPGIPEQYMNKIFDKFFRVPTGDRHNVKGYGLGLSFVALVMKHHDGKVEVRNLKEGGCEFLLIFPKK